VNILRRIKVLLHHFRKRAAAREDPADDPAKLEQGRLHGVIEKRERLQQQRVFAAGKMAVQGRARGTRFGGNGIQRHIKPVAEKQLTGGL
jgi:hypothetical protein